MRIPSTVQTYTGVVLCVLGLATSACTGSGPASGGRGAPSTLGAVSTSTSPTGGIARGTAAVGASSRTGQSLNPADPSTETPSTSSTAAGAGSNSDLPGSVPDRSVVMRLSRAEVLDPQGRLLLARLAPADSGVSGDGPATDSAAGAADGAAGDGAAGGGQSTGSRSDLLTAAPDIADICSFIFGSTAEVADAARLDGDVALDALSTVRTVDEQSPATEVACIYRAHGAAALMLQITNGPPVDAEVPGSPVVMAADGMQAALSYAPDRAGPRIGSSAARAWLTAALARIDAVPAGS